MKDNMALSGLSEKELVNILQKNSQKPNASVKDTLLLTIDKSGQGYLQLMKGQGIAFKTKELKSA